MGSFSVNRSTGAWADFATGDKGGDLVSLYAYLFHDGDQAAAARALAEMLGMPEAVGAEKTSGTVGPKRTVKSLKNISPAQVKEENHGQDLEVVMPVPDVAPEPPKAHIKRGLPEASWCYRDAEGRVLGFIRRFRTSDGGKEIVPLTLWRNVKTGELIWKDRAWPEPRPLYGLDRIAAKPDATVVIVEGEKCADAAQEEFPDLVVVSWPGGSGAVDKANWEPLCGRSALITWADADSQRRKPTKEEKAAGVDPKTLPYLPAAAQPGYKAMAAIRARFDALNQAGKMKLYDVQLPEPGALPDGYDVVDAIAGGLKGEALRGWLRENAKPFGKPHAPPKAGAGRRGKPPHDDEWRDKLLWKKGELTDCLANVYDILSNRREWAGVLAWDEFSVKTMKCRPPPYGGDTGAWEGVDDSRTAMWLTREECLQASSQRVAEAVETLARANPIHPVRDWLRSLPQWDGVRRLPTWLSDFLGVQDSEYVRRVGAFFLRGMVYRVMRPGCKFDYCLVLEGPQGKGKSSALRILAGEWFQDTDLDLNNKDAMASLAGVWLYEFAELGSVTRAESTRQKSFLSRQSDKYRPVYGRRDITALRQVAFAGTTNDWEWNKDPTGGRRFWPVDCRGELNLEGLEAIRNQLFAESLSDYDAGRRYWPTPQEQQELFDPEQLQREQPDSLVDTIHDWVFKQVQDFSVSNVILDCLKLTPDKQTRDLQTRIGIALRKLGCKRVEKRNGMVRYWWRAPMIKDGQTHQAQSVPQRENSEDGGEYVPF